MTAGADKRFGTTDDFSAERLSWRYFLPLGAVIDLAIRNYHERTRGYVRDVATLREELSKAGVALDQLRDRWGQPYRFEFGVYNASYMLIVSSGGPDKTFSGTTHTGVTILISGPRRSITLLSREKRSRSAR